MLTLIHRNKSVDLSFQSYTTLHKTRVLPVIAYSSSVWGQRKFSKLNTAQIKAMRNFLCLTLTLQILYEMEWTVISITIQMNILKL